MTDGGPSRRDATPADTGEDLRPASLLPRRDGRDQALGFVIGVLCFVGCVALFAGFAAHRAAAGWGRALSGSATVMVRPGADETPSEAAARAAEALAGVKGVSEARALDRAAAEKLLEPWVGQGALPPDLPIPRLVAVELNPSAPAGAEALRAALKEARVDGVVDDHARWQADISRAGRLAGGLALGAGALMAAAAAAAIAFATRAGLDARRGVVEVLHLTGAEDGFIAGLFQRRFAALSAGAGAAGALAAAALAAALRVFGGPGGFTPALPLAWSDLWPAAVCPVAAALVGAIAARRAAMSTLAHRPQGASG